MARKTKNIQLSFSPESGTLTTLFRRLSGSKGEYDFESLAHLRNLLSNEKARLLHVIKTRQPPSLYALAKMVDRDFKSVVEDIKTLERFGLVDLVAERSGKRVRHKPIVIVDSLQIEVKI